MTTTAVHWRCMRSQKVLGQPGTVAMLCWRAPGMHGDEWPGAAPLARMASNRFSSPCPSWQASSWEGPGRCTDTTRTGTLNCSSHCFIVLVDAKKYFGLKQHQPGRRQLPWISRECPRCQRSWGRAAKKSYPRGGRLVRYWCLL